jgi:hypothetical protein
VEYGPQLQLCITFKSKGNGDCNQEKHIRIGSDLPMHRMGFDAMRIGGLSVWGGRWVIVLVNERVTAHTAMKTSDYQERTTSWNTQRSEIQVFWFQNSA